MKYNEVVTSENTGSKPVLLIGGKGGVGKTTCSSAIALSLASRGSRTLLVTSDLTPSLSDILEQEIGDAVKTVSRNLDAYEVSQEAIVGRWKGRFGPDFYDILAHLIDVEALDAESRTMLLDYIGSAPSLREETMLDVIMDLAENRGYGRIVWDTAPAGETLNLLGMLKNIRKHLRAGVKVYEGLDRIGKNLIGKRSITGIMDEWAVLSDNISRFIHEKSAFVVVANPEALVVNQARRLIQTLSDYQLPVHGLIINRVIEQADSPSLKSMQELQTRYRAELKKMAGKRPVVALPLTMCGIRGLDQLRPVGELLVAGLSL